MISTRNTPILFDLDGTITDNSVGIVTSTLIGLAAVGVDDVSEADIRAQIGPPLRSMYATLGLSSHDVETAVRAYRGYYTETGVLENVVYEGVAEALETIAATDRCLALATSKPEGFAEQILGHFGLDHHFTFIGGATLDGNRETKADVVAHTLRSLDMSPEAAVMIGDRRHDIDGARHIGVTTSIGVTWGFGSASELRAAGATVIVDDAAALIAALTADPDSA